MKESEILYDNYDYVMFVDASGDDGFCFKERSSDGSSFTFVASCFVVKPTDIEHNKTILLNMKTALNLPTERELKSTTLKRHRFAKDAYSYLNSLKGQCFSTIAFKKDLVGKEKYAEYCDVSSKRLSGLTQAFPYYAIHKSNYFIPTDRILIVMDNMKKSEMDVVKELLDDFGISDDVSSNYDLIFRDSKHEKYALIQIADIIAGTIRSYFENNLIRSPLQLLCKSCKASRYCTGKNSGRKLLKSHYIDPKYEQVLLLHRSPVQNLIMLIGIITLPLKHFHYYKYIDCKLGNKKRS